MNSKEYFKQKFFEHLNQRQFMQYIFIHPDRITKNFKNFQYGISELDFSYFNWSKFVKNHGVFIPLVLRDMFGKEFGYYCKIPNDDKEAIEAFEVFSKMKTNYVKNSDGDIVIHLITARVIFNSIANTIDVNKDSGKTKNTYLTYGKFIGKTLSRFLITQLDENYQ